MRQGTFVLAAVLFVAWTSFAACGSSSSEGDGDADTDGDTDGAQGDCESNCGEEARWCGDEARTPCIDECETAGTVDGDAWADCLNTIVPPCGQFDENCCIRARSCRGF